MSMTEKEAIEWLDKDTSPMKIHIAEMKNENPMDYINSAIRIAIEAIVAAEQYREIGTVEEYRTAIEKIKPKKVELEQDEYNNDCLECPNCGSFIGYASDCKEEHYQVNYCPHCGQAIDWSEENE